MESSASRTFLGARYSALSLENGTPPELTEEGSTFRTQCLDSDRPRPKLLSHRAGVPFSPQWKMRQILRDEMLNDSDCHLFIEAVAFLDCNHENILCLNHYETFRKYLCRGCGEVLMCECEKELALRFRPYQIAYGHEYGTQKKYKVTGFSPNICLTCRGQREGAHPMAYGGKIERYYWREIEKTYWKMVLEWLTENKIPLENSMKFEIDYPEDAKLLKRETKQIWQKRHKEAPLYIINEPTESDFLAEVKVPERYSIAKYVQVQEGREKIGKWINQMGKPCSIEEVVADWYRNRGFYVKRCEGALISVLVGTFCAAIILEPITPARFKRPANVADDFGSREFSKRKSEDFGKLISTLEHAEGLEKLFEELLPASWGLRRYLWGGHDDDEAVDLGRMAIRTMPQSLIIKCVEWGFQHFWDRRPGWPDLFVSKDKDFLFVEVKSTLARHHDKLSLAQMQWFRWAVKEVNMPCEIVRVKEENASIH